MAHDKRITLALSDDSAEVFWITSGGQKVSVDKMPADKARSLLKTLLTGIRSKRVKVESFIDKKEML